MVHCGLVVFFGLIGAPNDPALEELSPGPQLRCGADSLYFALKQLGHHSEYDLLLQRCEIGTDGTSLKQLAEVADEHGLFQLTVRLRARALCEVLRFYPVPLLAICHENRGHFFLAYRNQHAQVTLVDSTTGEIKEDADVSDLSEFSGHCLLLSEANIGLDSIQRLASQSMDWSTSGMFCILGAGLLSLAVGLLCGGRSKSRTKACAASPLSGPLRSTFPLVMVACACSVCGCQPSTGGISRQAESDVANIVSLGSTTSVDVGTVFYLRKPTTPATPTLSFTLNNPFDEPIANELVNSSCGCSNAWIDLKQVPAHSESRLHIRINPGIAGERSIVVSIDHGRDRKTILRIKGRFFDTCQVKPTQLYFPRVTPDKRSRSSVAYVHLTSQSHDPPGITCRVPDGEFVKAGPITLRATQQIDRGVFRHVFQVPVRLSNEALSATAASRRTSLSVLIGESQVVGMLSVTWTPESLIVVAPRSVVLNTAVTEQRVVIRTHNGSPIRINALRLSEEGAPIRVSIDSRDERRDQHIVTLSRECGAVGIEREKGKARLLIEVDDIDDGAVTIPVAWDL